MGDEQLHWSERAKLAGPSGYALSAPPLPPPRKSKKKYVVGGVAALVVAVVAVVVALVVSSGESATTARAAASSVTSLYEDPVLGCSFAYPASWVEFDRHYVSDATDDWPTGVAFGDPAGETLKGVPANFVFFAAKESESSIQLLKLGLGVMATQVSQLEGVETVEPVRDIEVNGFAGIALTWTARNYESTQCMVRCGDILCMFALATDLRNYTDHEPLLDAVLASLKVP